MQEALSPAVQVVTVSDWPAVVTGIVTAVVGLVGILATYRQGKRGQEAASKNLMTSINAENERARTAEKRRIYTRYLAACWDVWIIQGKKEIGPEENEALESELNTRMTAAIAASSEIGLIAPLQIAALADEVLIALLKYKSNAQQTPSDYHDLRRRLLAVMREDLHLPVIPESQPDL